MSKKKTATRPEPEHDETAPRTEATQPEGAAGASEQAPDQGGANAAETVGIEEGQEPDGLTIAREEAEMYKDSWLRAKAELENFRRRTARERQELLTRAGERILRQVLEPIDNLARGIASARDTAASSGMAEENGEALVRGMELIYQQFMTVLEREKVSLMESTGQPFDPMKHEAMVMVERDDLPSSTVVDEMERGYYIGERVLRHAKVIVSRAPDADKPEVGSAGPEPADSDETHEKKDES